MRLIRTSGVYEWYKGVYTHLMSYELVCMVTAASSFVVDIHVVFTTSSLAYRSHLWQSANYVSPLSRLSDDRASFADGGEDTCSSRGFCELLSGLFQLTSFRRCRRPSSPVTFSRYRTRQLVWSLALVVTTTSRRSSRHFVGCQSVSEWSSRRRCWCEVSVRPVT